MHEKFQALIDTISQYERVGICLSGGSGSALVAVAATEALGAENVVAITADTPFFTGEEMKSSVDLSKKLGIKLLQPKTNLLDNEKVVANTLERCYLCKRVMMDAVRSAAAEKVEVLLDGSTPSGGVEQDAKSEKVLKELDIVSPLRLAKVSRDEVHQLLKEQGYSYYIQPENACLATRIASGEPITLKKLRWIRAAENFIHSLGFELVRVRVQNMVARIEVREEDVQSLFEMEDMVRAELLVMGFKEVEIDETGYHREAASCL